MNRATTQRISHIARIATAQWRMIGDMAFRIRSTCAWTRIDTFLIDAGAIRWTLAVHDTLGSTLYIGIAIVFGNACARADLVACIAQGIDAARCRMTRMDWLIFTNKQTVSDQFVALIGSEPIGPVDGKRILRRTMGEHSTNGSPVYPLGQPHTGRWYRTAHWAFAPHVPWHGS